MELWKLAWRALAKFLPTSGLVSLREAVETDDPKLLQGATTSPPLMCVQDWPIEGACATGWCGWKGNDLKTVGEVEKFFAERCHMCDEELKEPAGVRHFLNWFDDTPRNEMRRLLLPEIDLILAQRTTGG